MFVCVFCLCVFLFVCFFCCFFVVVVVVFFVFVFVFLFFLLLLLFLFFVFCLFVFCCCFFFIFVSFFPENRLWRFMPIVSYALLSHCICVIYHSLDRPLSKMYIGIWSSREGSDLSKSQQSVNFPLQIYDSFGCHEN